MTRTAFIVLLFTLSFSFCFGQTKDTSSISTDPENARIFFTDISNFWTAFDKTFQNQDSKAFADLYMNAGTPGVHNFIDNNRIVSADTLRNFVIANKVKYEVVRKNTLLMPTTEKQIRSAYYAFKYLYQQAKFPPLYFVIGRFNTGGTAKPDYQIIGSEMNEPGNIAYLVAHETIHSNQNIPYKYKILLEQCIIEGSADFLGELISGKIANRAAYEYAIGREKYLWDDFVKDMNLGENDSFSNWLYGGVRKDKRPQDMGYYIGYVITKAYYDKAKNKQTAIAEILNVQDCKKFLSESGYGANVINSSLSIVK